MYTFSMSALLPVNRYCRKSVEVENLRKRIDELLRKNAILKIEVESSKHQASIAEESIKSERERRAQAELDLCAVKTLQQSLDERLKSVSEEANEWKLKLKQKSEEMKDVIQSLTETQKFASTANAKLQAENEELRARNSTLTEEVVKLTQNGLQLQSQIKGHERAVEVSRFHTMRLPKYHAMLS